MTATSNSVELRDGIIEIVETGKQNRESIEMISKETTRLSQMISPVLLLVDVSNVTKVDLGARIAGKNVANEQKFDRMAFVGATPVLRALVNLIVKATNSKEIKLRFFSSREEAIGWLKELLPKKSS